VFGSELNSEAIVWECKGHNRSSSPPRCRLKHVCIQCGEMLPVDRDLDDDRTFEYVVARHNDLECPHGFSASDERPTVRLELTPPASPLPQ